MIDRTTDSLPISIASPARAAADLPHAAKDGSTVSVPLIVESEVSTAAEQPVTLGVPWPRGVLADDQVILLIDSSGRGMPLQTTPLAHWPDRSVKWLLLDFVLAPGLEGRDVWMLEARHRKTQARPRTEGALVVGESGRHLVIGTGSASFTLDQDVLAPILQAELEGSPLLHEARTRTVLIDARGVARRPLIERCEIEADGPVRATVRLEGAFEGRRRERLRFLARLSFFAGSPLVRVDLTLHNPRRARHRGGLWDLGDPGSILFRDLSLQLGLSGPGYPPVRWIEDVGVPPQEIAAMPFEIYQDSSGGENWRSRNHVNRYGVVPCQFRGYRVRRGSETSSSLRASPVVSVQVPSGAVTVAIPEFWQQFPKAIEMEGGTLNIRFFPGQFGDSFELQGGEQKTHTAWIRFSRGDRTGTDAMAWVHRPARVHCLPEWYAETNAIPYLVPASRDPADRYETYLSAIVEGPRSFFARREIIDEYGWRNFGEVYADHEGEHYEGEPPVISHYNNQYDLVHGLLRQYLRSGHAGWMDLADPLARHVIDIDIYHTDRDKAAYNGGLFWHTNHYQDAKTCTHRSYSRHNFKPGDPFGGGGPSSNHNYSTGLLLYYYLTGDPKARDAAVGLADWVINMDDGEQSIFGVLEPAPTGHATYPGETNYQGPCRGAGNSINTLIDGWLLTCRPSFMDKAEALIRRVSHPHDNIPGRNLLNVEPRWSYTVFLSALARYMAVKAEAGRLDSMYSYARAVLLCYTEWMVNHERPYFDQAEKLEFPNETWAAQEFRKANVMRLAAAHADEPIRSALLRRGGEFTERAWEDLKRFESCTSTRAVALLLTEGLRSEYLARTTPTIYACPTAHTEFDEPEHFVPQKERVFSSLRTVGGLIRAVLLLCDVRNWRKACLRGFP